MTARSGSFVEQVGKLRDSLRDRLAALDYVAALNTEAQRDAAYTRDRETGGMVIDPVDPTRVVVPIVWLRALLQCAQVRGYNMLAESDQTRALLDEWNTNYGRRDAAEYEPLHREHAALAERLSAFMATL
jgi:hypothetical protein